MKKKTYIGNLLLITAILVVINIISSLWFFRLDLTENKQYSLSKVTKQILDNLDETVTVTAYFTKDLPPNLQKVKQDFKNLLIEYNKRSKGKVAYKFVNPNEKPEYEREAVQSGIRPVLLNAREKDQIKQQKIYMGAKVMLGTKSEVIPFISGRESMEYILTSAIKKLSVKQKPVVGFIKGNGETTLNEMPQAVKQLEVLYKVETVKITDSVNLSKYKALAWVAPKDSINTEVLNKLDEYLNSGGNIFIAMNRVDADLQNMQGKAVNTGLETWLKKKGIDVPAEFIVDKQCGTVGVTQRQGVFNITTQVQFPYLPVITHFAEHPVTKGIEEVILDFASPIKFTGDTSVNYKPLAFTSEYSGTVKTPMFINIQKQWTPADFNKSNIPVAALFSGIGSGRIILITDGDFARNGSGRNMRKISENNVNLFVNSIDFLADDTGLIELRTKIIQSRPLKQISEGKIMFLKWLNFLLPVLLIVLYGIIRAQYRKNQRIKRMEEDYVK